MKVWSVFVLNTGCITAVLVLDLVYCSSLINSDRLSRVLGLIILACVEPYTKVTRKSTVDKIVDSRRKCEFNIAF